MSDKRAKRGKVWEPVGQACLVLHVGGTVATIGLFPVNSGAESFQSLARKESIRKVLVMPGTVLLREGSPGDSMMVISKGAEPSLSFSA